jgi:hypothetical protein
MTGEGAAVGFRQNSSHRRRNVPGVQRKLQSWLIGGSVANEITRRSKVNATVTLPRIQEWDSLGFGAFD